MNLSTLASESTFVYNNVGLYNFGVEGIVQESGLNLTIDLEASPVQIEESGLFLFASGVGQNTDTMNLRTRGLPNMASDKNKILTFQTDGLLNNLGTGPFYIRPTPLVSISRQSLRNEIGDFGGRYTITMTGAILDDKSLITDDSEVDSDEHPRRKSRL